MLEGPLVSMRDAVEVGLACTLQTVMLVGWRFSGGSNFPK